MGHDAVAGHDRVVASLFSVVLARQSSCSSAANELAAASASHSMPSTHLAGYALGSGPAAAAAMAAMAGQAAPPSAAGGSQGQGLLPRPGSTTSSLGLSLSSSLSSLLGERLGLASSASASASSCGIGVSTRILG